MNKECEHCLYRDWYCPVCIYYADNDEEDDDYDDIYDDLDSLDIDDIMQQTIKQKQNGMV